MAGVLHTCPLGFKTEVEKVVTEQRKFVWESTCALAFTKYCSTSGSRPQRPKANRRHPVTASFASAEELRRFRSENLRLRTECAMHKDSYGDLAHELW